MTQTAKRRVLRIAIYVFLMASAGAAFLLGDWLRAAARLGDVPTWAPLVAPSIFTLFVVVYAVDRWLLVKRQRHSLGRAFFQVAFAIVFVSLLWLWPQQVPRGRGAAVTNDVIDFRSALLEDRNPNVRAAACELIGLRGQGEALERVTALAAHDNSEQVRGACAEAAIRLHAPMADAADVDPDAGAVSPNGQP